MGDLGSITGLGKSPGGGHGNPLQYSCLENAQGQRRLVCYSPWDRRGSDTTEVAEHTRDVILLSSVRAVVIIFKELPSFSVHLFSS